MITVPEFVLSNIRSLLAFAHRAAAEAERDRLGRVIDRDAITSVSTALRIALVDITIGVPRPKFAAIPLKNLDLAIDVLNSVSYSSLPALLQNAKKSLSDASSQMRPYLVAIGEEQAHSEASSRRRLHRAPAVAAK